MKKLFYFLLITFSFLLLTFNLAFSYLQYPNYKKLPFSLKTYFSTKPYKLVIKFDEEDKRPRLFAVTKQKEIKITEPSELLKIIPRLRSKAQALAFVRLFTDGYSHKLFLQPAALEVFIANKKNIHLLNDDRYGWGLLHPERAKELKILPAKIKKTSWGYIIQRNLLFYPQAGHHLRLSRVTEHINVKKKTYYFKQLQVISNAPWTERLLVKLESSKP